MRAWRESTSEAGQPTRYSKVKASRPGVLSAAAGGGATARAELMMRRSCEVRLQGSSSQEREERYGSTSAAWRSDSSSLDASLQTPQPMLGRGGVEVWGEVWVWPRRGRDS